MERKRDGVRGFFSGVAERTLRGSWARGMQVGLSPLEPFNSFEIY